VRAGLAETIRPDDDYKVRDAKEKKFRKYMSDIRAANLIKVDGETIIDLRK
jgi:hypothetical protein